MGTNKSWLLLPEDSLNYFQKNNLAFPSCTPIQEIYTYIESFEEKYPKDSMQFIFLHSLSKSNLSYEHIKKSLQDAFYKNQSLRWSFKKLLNQWLSTRLEQVNTTDLVTTEIPKQPVFFFETQKRKKYVFEASTILKDSYIRLLQHDGLILDSQMPRNPFTNNDLTLYECISFHNQLRKNGITNWLWEAFAQQSFSLEKLQEYFEVPMRLHVLQTVFIENRYQAHDLLVDFIIQQYENHNKQSPTEALLYKVIRTCSNHPFLEDWISVCKEFWSYQIRPNAFTEEKQIEVAEKTRKLLIVSHYWVNLLKTK